MERTQCHAVQGRAGREASGAKQVDARILRCGAEPVVRGALLSSHRNGKHALVLRRQLDKRFSVDMLVDRVAHHEPAQCVHKLGPSHPHLRVEYEYGKEQTEKKNEQINQTQCHVHERKEQTDKRANQTYSWSRRDHKIY